ncbi:SDR family NAD(P)-dependent oxidoreductase [Microbispora siamensis]
MPAAVIIGAGPGIGQAVARRFAREGFAITLIARKREVLHTGSAMSAPSEDRTTGACMPIP